jgi:hypothetical protein
MSLLRLPFASLSARTRSLGRLLLLFLAINASVRLVLALGWGGDPALRSWQLLPAMVIGAVFDIAIGVLALAPLAWLFAAWPRVRLGGALGLRRAAIAFVLPLSLLAAFTAAAEFAFWNEFGTRFNFIAVEYLVYGNEVIGNIR